MKKICDVCGYETSRDECVCPACGEASWREVEEKLPPPPPMPSFEPKKSRR